MQSVTKPQTNPKLARGVALVRQGWSLERAASEIGFTMAALRTACFKDGHRFSVNERKSILRTAEVAQRRAQVLAMFEIKTPLPQIASATGMTLVGIKKLVKRELGVDLAVKGKSKRRTELKVARARRVGRLYLENQHTKHHVALTVLAGRNGLSKYALAHAVKMLRKAALDPYANVTDTAFERRPE